MKKNQTLRLAIAQINTCVGDISGNTEKIIAYIDQARARNCDIISFPELAVCGYPPEDLLFKKSFVEENIKQLEIIKKRAEGIVAIVGFVDRKQNRLFNSAAVMANGKIVDIYNKINLPNYGVFDEKRYFASGSGFSLYEARGICFCVNICEDIWAYDGTIVSQARSGARLIININASPYHMGKIGLRQKVLKEQAKANNVFISYANLVGGQDELVFDGQSMLISPKGKVLAVGNAFKEDLCVLDLEFEKKKAKSKKAKFFSISLPEQRELSLLKMAVPSALTDEDEVFRALVLGVKDYVSKNGFKKVVFGLSGGIDSSLVACIAKEAVGKENVIGVILPSQFNSQDSRDDAVLLAKNLGIEHKLIPIEEIFSEYLLNLKPHFLNLPWSIAEENIQARIRGNILMALSNKFGWLVLTTGNKSEMSVGYATLYGDMAGGFAVIKDVFKTLVYEVSEFYNGIYGREIIPRRVFEKAPTAELRENQKDSDSLPVYEVLDPILKYYVEEDLSSAEIIKKGFNQETVAKVIRLVDNSEYKRRQAPPGIKITPRAFGRDRRMPITNRFKEEVI